MEADQQARRPRRAAKPEERGKAADQTRERVLQAALEEFGAKGYAGARTAGIAARAGVNQQLISYYFGGKQGVLDELRRRWRERQASLTPAGRSFDESFAGYLDDTLDNADWSRLVIWRSLGDSPDAGAPGHREQKAGTAEAIASIRRRQAAGELTDVVEAEFILLLSHVLAFAPVALPQFVEAILGVKPHSAEYRQRCREQLAALLAPQ
ncbi:TetR family transcriptional regulator [Micromonospora sp. NPDC047740]|uniref:TetR/AcrR family transcriptional regulator n=1 Tax=Micromonospora sp. NPDC047740 TaxID=3364254 RepID=UPI0037124C5A